MEIQAIRSTATVDTTAQTKAASAAAPQKPAGPPPAGGARPAKPAGGPKPAETQAGAQSTDSSTSTSSTKKTYDKRDANQDGTVSSQEELLYTLTHPNEENKSQMTASAIQLQNGLKAYQQG